MVTRFDQNDRADEHTDAHTRPGASSSHQAFINELVSSNFQRTRVADAQPTHDQVMFTPLNGFDNTRHRNLADIATQFEGKQVWKDTGHAKETVNGKFGCAASESRVLQEAGYRYADALTVAQLHDQLRHHGWTTVDFAHRQPGDVLMGYESGTHWKAGGGTAHVGTVAQDGEIWNNSKRRNQTWAKEPLDVAMGSCDRFIVLRPPAGASGTLKA